MSIYREMRTQRTLRRPRESRRIARPNTSPLRVVPDLANCRRLESLYRSLDLPQLDLDAALGGKKRKDK